MSRLLITISASYGSGGSVVAPALAQQLEAPCLQRLTTAGGTLRPASMCHERLVAGEAATTPAHHLLASLAHALPAGPTQSPLPPRVHHRALRREAEADIHRLAAEGRGVILGRGAAVVLGKDRGFHVRLDGPADRRVARAAEIEGTSLEESRAHMRAADKARTAYVRRLYGVDPSDPSLYHLVIDSTAISLETVVELILTAASDHQTVVGIREEASLT
jgi:cytidylate kinase